MAVAACALFAGAAVAQVAERRDVHWIGSWGAAPAASRDPAPIYSFDGQTLRLMVHTSIGGRRVRIRLSNELGTEPLQVASAHIALRKNGADIEPGTDRVLTFSGRESAVIAPGAPLLSDPVTLDVPAMAELAVSLYLPGRVQARTVHDWAAQTSYVSVAGNFAANASFPVERSMKAWSFLTEVDVEAAADGAVVALGDSITDASRSTADTNRRWTDLLERRLQSAGISLGVVNRGISGNRLLHDPGERPVFGPALLARFDRDALATAGVRYVVVLIGLNDIGHPGTGTIPLAELPSVADLVAGYRQLVARTHAAGLKIYGATLTPFEGTTFANFYSADKARVRDALNGWIRTSGEFDAVIDFDAALRDPAAPSKLLPKYDSGDHLHPNDAGMQAMADAIPLALFRDAAPAGLPQ
jgi:lysophospholipase L1-like esterase